MEENPTAPKPTVMSVGLKYGLILTVASIAITMILIALGTNPFQGGWKGLFSFAVTIGIIVWAHMTFKSEGDGFMTYGQGFQIGFIAIMVSILISGVFNYVYAAFLDPALLEEVWQKTADDMEAKGQTQETIDIAIEWTKKLFWVIYFVVGIFIALFIGCLVPIFTQKKNPDAIPS